MTASLGFEILIDTINLSAIPELKGRLDDFSPAFETIVSKWVKHNEKKFMRAKNMEWIGVEQTPNVEWEKLTEDYIYSKRARGFEDWLMVRTGDLMESMTNENAIFSEIMPMEVAFGSPKDDEDRAKVAYNWSKRQVIYLDRSDQNMITETISSYLKLGPDFAHIEFARGMNNVQRREERARMYADFVSAVEGEG